MPRALTVKQELALLLEEVLEEVKAGRVKEHAYNRIAKSLARVHRAATVSRRRHCESYVITACVEDSGAMYDVPPNYDYVIRTPVFWRRLVAAKRRVDGKKPHVVWLANLMDGFLGVWLFEPVEDSCLERSRRARVRDRICVLLSTHFHVFDALVDRLELVRRERSCDVRASTLFPVQLSVDDPVPLEDGADRWLWVWRAVTEEPRFLTWLLSAGHGYSDPQVTNLQERAVVLIDTKPSQKLDAGLLGALGLRSSDEVLFVQKEIARGVSFVDARALALIPSNHNGV